MGHTIKGSKPVLIKRHEIREGDETGGTGKLNKAVRAIIAGGAIRATPGLGAAE